MRPMLLLAVLLSGCLGWTFFRQRGRLFPPPLAASASPAVESWTGVWMGGNALLRLRQRGAVLEGEYGPEDVFAKLTGRASGNSAVFTAPMHGKRWAFRLTRTGSVARLTGHPDIHSLIDRPRAPILITPSSRAEREHEREQEQQRLAEERNEARQWVDFGEFERIE